MQNAYIQDNYAPIQQEHTCTDLPVTGEIPAHLDGRYLRNGPNPISEIDPATYSWFMGDGMVHGIRLRDGKAEWYRNRWVRSPNVTAGWSVTRAILARPVSGCQPNSGTPSSGVDAWAYRRRGIRPAR